MRIRLLGYDFEASHRLGQRSGLGRRRASKGETGYLYEAQAEALRAAGVPPGVTAGEVTDASAAVAEASVNTPAGTAGHGQP